ncbi:hypothetical protein [Aquirufa nivalisilvae]
MSLSEYFDDEIQKEYVKRSLKVGSVIKLFVKDTIPPKEKRFIIVGISPDKLVLATIFINTDINYFIQSTPELVNLQIKLESEGREYLDTDSHIDCSKLVERGYSEIENILFNKPDAIIGTLSEEDYFIIKSALISSKGIKGKHKKKFGFYS